MSKSGRKAFSQVLNDLAAASHPAISDLKALSDLSHAHLDEFKQRWPAIPAATRVQIMTRLGELAEDAIELNINAVSRAALHDPEAGVRAAAIRNLWEDEGRDLIGPFLYFLTKDDSEDVRTAAASGLGIFVYLGEMEELPAEETRRVEDALLEIYNGSDALDVRRRALESLGFSPRPEASAAIDEAYNDGDELLRVSALFAMGRSLDPERWAEPVVEDLNHSSAQVRFEAARAAGELQLEEAATALGRLLHDSDAEVQEISVWALGEIGGDEARRLLQDRLATADEELTALIEDAMNNADLMGDMFDFGALPYGDEDDDDEQARKARLN